MPPSSHHENPILGTLAASKLPSSGVAFTGGGTFTIVQTRVNLGGQSTNRHRLESTGNGSLSPKTRGGQRVENEFMNPGSITLKTIQQANFTTPMRS